LNFGTKPETGLWFELLWMSCFIAACLEEDVCMRANKVLGMLATTTVRIDDLERFQNAITFVFADPQSIL
jgi:hypothetical protein